MVVAPEALYATGALSSGEKTTGNIVLAILAATAPAGILTVQPCAAGESAYVAVE